MSEQIAASRLTAQVEHEGGVLIKLILFSLTLAIAPLSSYFLSRDYVWNGNSTYAAITAIVAANAVLVAYIATSLMEESKLTRREKEGESRKQR
ncbi:Vacuolar ATPase assembly integral membrane protein vma-21 [Grifola frondosa]|uniref:Vacuolar ATPase assembly integral membrane protein vma-21 n=1 Tax=Grifola frondosa TaxID=5627 RepID=A0A1C7MPP3_GRIFR|nr:Vacuolar ATPase assembly integral membrane protein vma-21 [Grifola frondosa]